MGEGGKCWFAVESKTFEISIEEVQGKKRGTIVERRKGFSSWIRFGAKSLSCLLEGVEAWCRGESNSRGLKVWEEGGRKFRLECRANDAGRFLLCSVRDVEAKQYCLVFPEGRGLVGGWMLLAQKLRAVGVSTPALNKGDMEAPVSDKDGGSIKGNEKGKGSYAEIARVKTGEPRDSLWVHIGDHDLGCREEQLNRCLVGCFGDSVESVPPLFALKVWALERWSLKGGLKISRLG